MAFEEALDAVVSAFLTPAKLMSFGLRPDYVMLALPESATPGDRVNEWANDVMMFWGVFVANHMSEISEEDLDLLEHLYEHILLDPTTERIENPTKEQVRASVIIKLMRNMALGLIDCFIVAEGMYRYVTEVLKVPPRDEPTIFSFLQASPRFVLWLSSLHDNQETQVLYNELLGFSGDMSYQLIPPGQMVDGVYGLSLDCFHLVGSPEKGYIGVKGYPEPRRQFGTPRRSCPMLRAGGIPLFWDECVQALIVAMRWRKKRE